MSLLNSPTVIFATSIVLGEIKQQPVSYCESWSRMITVNHGNAAGEPRTPLLVSVHAITRDALLLPHERAAEAAAKEVVS